jgi:hypothetical protein
MNKPTYLSLEDGGTQIVACVTANGFQWWVTVYMATSEEYHHMFPVLPDRPDNGVLAITAFIRNEYGISGTWKPGKEKPLNNLKIVSELIEYYIQDIDDIDQKDYLMTAMESNITRNSELPRLYVKQVIRAYFDGFSC